MGVAENSTMLNRLVKVIKTEISWLAPNRVMEYDILVRQSEPTLAIFTALNWSLDNLWDISPSICDQLEEWSNSQNSYLVKSTVNKALGHARSKFRG